MVQQISRTIEVESQALRETQSPEAPEAKKLRLQKDLGLQVHLGALPRCRFHTLANGYAPCIHRCVLCPVIRQVTREVHWGG